MPPRKRKAENQGLEPNVYTDKKQNGVTYYTYVHPIDHWKEPLGKDREAANRTARALNSALERSGVDPAQRTPMIRGTTVEHVVSELQPKMLTKLKPSSQKETRAWFRRINEMFGNRPLKAITVRELAEQLEPLKDRPYIRIRWHLIKIYEHALSRGYVPHNYGNPAIVLEKRSEPKRQRRRLTLEEFKAIYDEAPKWLQVAMGIFLHTGLRPVDIVNLKFSQFEDGCIKSQIRKTDKGLKIRLNESAQNIIKSARDGVVSPYVVHKLPERKGLTHPSKEKDHPTQLTVDMLSRRFREIRKQLGLGGDNPPSLYEIRSLCSRLYEDEGYDIKTIQHLLAHTNEKMTRTYLENQKNVVYVEVQAGLKVELN